MTTQEPRGHEAGFVGGIDGFVHAIRKRLNGDQALYGAGRIVGRVPGRFNPADEFACPACVALVREL